MAKIYVVTEGIYSDNGICVVTVDKDAAERAAKLCDGMIEEYDDFTEAENIFKNGFHYYTVFVDKDGCLSGVVEQNLQYLVGAGAVVCDMKPKVTRLNRYWNLGVHVVKCYARDEAHAKKIAYDAIAQYEAEQEGIC